MSEKMKALECEMDLAGEINYIQGTSLVEKYDEIGDTGVPCYWKSLGHIQRLCDLDITDDQFWQGVGESYIRWHNGGSR